MLDNPLFFLLSVRILLHRIENKNMKAEFSTELYISVGSVAELWTIDILLARPVLMQYLAKIQPFS